jgi:hypothetical protein
MTLVLEKSSLTTSKDKVSFKNNGGLGMSCLKTKENRVIAKF